MFCFTHTALQSVDRSQPESGRGQGSDVEVGGQYEVLLCVAQSQTQHPQHGVLCSLSRGLAFVSERR